MMKWELFIWSVPWVQASCIISNSVRPVGSRLRGPLRVLLGGIQEYCGNKNSRWTKNHTSIILVYSPMFYFNTSDLGLISAAAVLPRSPVVVRLRRYPRGIFCRFSYMRSYALVLCTYVPEAVFATPKLDEMIYRLYVPPSLRVRTGGKVFSTPTIVRGSPSLRANRLLALELSMEWRTVGQDSKIAVVVASMMHLWKKLEDFDLSVFCFVFFVRWF